LHRQLTVLQAQAHASQIKAKAEATVASLRAKYEAEMEVCVGLERFGFVELTPRFFLCRR
jgi:hypothetical protein